MASNYREFKRQFTFKSKVNATVRLENCQEDDPIEVTNHHKSVEIINNLTKMELNDVDFMTRLDREIQRRKMQGSGRN